jgi:hypothetical protein
MTWNDWALTMRSDQSMGAWNGKEPRDRNEEDLGTWKFLGSRKSWVPEGGEEGIEDRAIRRAVFIGRIPDCRWTFGDLRKGMRWGYSWV